MDPRVGKSARGWVVALAAVSLVGAFAAPAASAVDSPQVTGPGTGAQPKGQRLGSKAALAQETCAPNGHTSFSAVGTGPFCVNPWTEGKNNGGATAQGVTAKSVKVVAYLPNEQMATPANGLSPAKNLATGENVNGWTEALRDWRAMYDYAIKENGTYQLWGRTPEITSITASGPDETAQRADAVKVIAEKPFMVFDLTGTASGGAAVFSTETAQAKIVTVSPSTTPENADAQGPYRWNPGADQNASSPLNAAFLARSLAGEKAKWAGDKDYHSKTRSFGMIYPTTGFDLDEFKSDLKAKSNGKATIAEAVGYDLDDTVSADALVPTAISKFKSSGVTIVLLFANNALVAKITEEATKADYHPEWLVTGYGYHDFIGFARTYDQEQWAHAFGLAQLYPFIEGETEYPYLNPFTWFHGDKQGVSGGNVTSTLSFLFPTLHYAGPTLTAENVRKGWFSVPAEGGAATGTVTFQSGFGNTVGMPYPEYSGLGTDRSMAFYDPDTEGLGAFVPIPDQGVWWYLNDGQRFTYKDMPTSEPAFFNKKGAAYQVTIASQQGGGTVPASTPCTGCPSSGVPLAT